MEQRSLQDRYGPKTRCFGCGPANANGLQIKSFERDGEVVADWTPSAHHEAFDGVLNGGIIGTLLDCHCNWTAAAFFMRERGAAQPPVTVTAEYTVQLRRPTPMDGPVHLRARVVESDGRKATVEGTLEAGGKECARCRGLFVAVEEGHPAFGRW
jgi:acyl-coenzyme A thioesterase PaaI-like protein